MRFEYGNIYGYREGVLVGVKSAMLSKSDFHIYNSRDEYLSFNVEDLHHMINVLQQADKHIKENK